MYSQSDKRRLASLDSQPPPSTLTPDNARAATTCQRWPTFIRPIVPRNECSIRNGRRRRREEKEDEEKEEASNESASRSRCMRNRLAHAYYAQSRPVVCTLERAVTPLYAVTFGNRFVVTSSL